MLQTVGYAMIGSALIIILGVMFLNKLGIIPVIRFGTLFKAFVVLTVIICIGFAYQGVKDKFTERKAKQAMAKITKESKEALKGNWKADTTGYVIGFDNKTVKGLFDQAESLDYEIVSEKVMKLSYNGEEIGYITFNVSEDKQRLVIGDAYNSSTSPESYTKTNEKVTPISDKKSSSTISNDSTSATGQTQEVDEEELEAQPLADSVTVDVAKQFIIGDWENNKNGKIIILTEKEYITDPNSKPYTYEVLTSETIQVKGEEEGEKFDLIFKYRFYNQGSIMELSYINPDTGEETVSTFVKIK